MLGPSNSPTNQFYRGLNAMIQAWEEGKIDEVTHWYRLLRKQLDELEHSHKITDIELVEMERLLEERYQRFMKK